jgi:flagellar biosynthesis protein FlhB
LPKLFSVNGPVELLKALLKTTLVGLVGWVLFNSMFAECGTFEPMEQAVIHALKLIAHSFNFKWRVNFGCGFDAVSIA